MLLFVFFTWLKVLSGAADITYKFYYFCWFTLKYPQRSTSLVYLVISFNAKQGIIKFLFRS
ncbi:hypothetical protein BDF14DRAFT_1840572 [Spinellus fusiger]|nr:hypothetical protein BDF14DRAFT_1840572 [Spinellus fusiger]